jgi:hypothetical protein
LVESVSSQATGYKQIEMLGEETKGEIFREIVRKLPDKPPGEELPIKILKAYNRSKDKA